MEKLTRGLKSREKTNQNIVTEFWNHIIGTNIKWKAHTHTHTHVRCTRLFSSTSAFNWIQYSVHLFEIQCAVQVYYRIIYVTKLALTRA